MNAALRSQLRFRSAFLVLEHTFSDNVLSLRFVIMVERQTGVGTVYQPIYVAVSGTQHYYGADFLKPSQIVHLIKDPDNPHDHEAIKVDMTPIGKIGYVANSTYTVPKGCRGAGRIYDTFEHHVCGRCDLL